MRDEKCNREVKIKGDVLYLLLDAGKSIRYPAIAKKYAKHRGIEAYVCEERILSHDDLVDRLHGEGKITAEERELFLQIPFFYFDALIAWMDASKKIKIVFE